MSSSGFVQSLPTIHINNKNQLVEFGGGPSPLEVGAGVSLTHLRGFITFMVVDLTTNYAWSFQTEGHPATASQLATIHHTLFTANQVGTSSITQNGNVITVNTSAADSGGRTYQISFNPVGSQPTLILKTAGAAIAGDMSIQIINNNFVLQ